MKKYAILLSKLDSLFCTLQDNLQILRDLSLLQVQMRDLDGYKVWINNEILRNCSICSEINSSEKK